MQFATWEPIYLAILDDFGFSASRDEEAAKLLEGLLNGKSLSLFEVARHVTGRRIVICGNASCLAEDLNKLANKELDQDRDLSRAFIVADGATRVLLEKRISPDIVVTDLDGPLDAICKANSGGAVTVVHAHGDNLDAIRTFVPQLENVIGTVQCRPPNGLFNFGGFTDGDRCVFLAKELGAASIEFVGFDLNDESVTPRKKKKLAWAKKLTDLALKD